MSAIAAAEFEEVTKDYATGLLGMGALRAVSQVSLRIEPGEVFGLLGPNRAGKTTLVKILLSLCRPTDGRVHLFGRPLSERAMLRASAISMRIKRSPAIGPHKVCWNTTVPLP